MLPLPKRIWFGRVFAYFFGEIKQKLLDGFQLNSVGVWGMGQARTHLILIQIKGQMQIHFNIRGLMGGGVHFTRCNSNRYLSQRHVSLCVKRYH